MGFEWIDCDHPDKGVVSFIRRGSTPSKQLLFICNFVPVEYDNYEVGAPCFTTYKEVLNSDDVQFGGAGRLNSGNRTYALFDQCNSTATFYCCSGI